MSSSAQPSPGRRLLRLGLTVVLSAAVGAIATTGGASALAAGVPAAPDNLLVFPDRDFITVEGYQDHIGEAATIEVTRPGVGIVGSAQGVVAEGDVAFEVNHPGGYCWGAGTGLKVTPDIRPGDVASIRFGDTAGGDTRVQDGFVTEDAVQNGTTVTVTGHLGAGVNPANIEQRIIEPELTATAVGRRDVRALPGPLTPAPKGGYQSGLSVNGDVFTATYVFDDAAVAHIAANASLGERLLSWEVTDLIGNRQGVTIAEFGEPGGPGMGGCPNGPLASGPVGPTDVVAAKVPGGVKLTWTPALAIPGTPAITGYRATAVGQTMTGNEQVEVGRRITGQSARGTTITGLSDAETYDVEIASVSSVGETFPRVSVRAVTDTTPPTVAASRSSGSYAVPQTVTLTANEAGSEIYYTADGTDPLIADMLSPTAIHYTAPILVAADTTLRFVAFDPSNNVSVVGSRTYTITNTPTPDAPAFGSPTIGTGQVTLRWTSADPSITGYGVQAYDAAGATVGALAETTATSLVVTGLTADTPYFFTVQAKNVNGWGTPSAKLGPLTPQGAVVANAGPDRTGVVRNTRVALDGAGSTPGATYAWTQLATGTTNPIGATDPDRVALTGANTLSPSFTLPFYRYPMTNRPLTFQLTVTTAAGSRSDTALVVPAVDQVAIGTASWKAGDFRVTGAGSVVGATILIHSGSLAGPVLTSTGVVAAPPLAGGTFDVRLRNGAAPAARPATIWIESNRGGIAGPFTVN
ncbi:chitobiase/beta-hexosaminidase C-terminal domain-containing protein [Actinoplanes sp. NPDC051470]|uniref:fibronectin type III domain-containing protein n=1 Tax=Actinoplanes sp. NPDC051470 TaxID=3157224 RepID=UPI00341AEFE3